MYSHLPTGYTSILRRRIRKACVFMLPQRITLAKWKEDRIAVLLITNTQRLPPVRSSVCPFYCSVRSLFTRLS